ncbi:MAG: OmpH family outer membrane protein [Eudoraea sp.]|nr:OmpH family outer membrane protein [Eudoraea sp.]NNJ37884.1 OmpH family outer membrane protein [Flavobacteriaceae bacterium]MBT8209708.1 OmpH family outer membrane protein [Eudoraea sp.]MBT8222749.1 OmpH family outer membrane protein [Eudoraea sp.]MBT8311483.1 OmpH family outer membrane protein [Eudoraea sp.]
MKQKVLLILTATLLTSFAFSQRGVRIGYVDMEYILENVEEYREANEQLDIRVQKWKVEIEQKQSTIEQMKKDLQAEKVLLTDELIVEREEEILILEKEMIEYQQDRFGPQGDLVLQKQRLIQPIQDQVFNEVQQIGANKKYDFIFDKSADVVMLYSEKRHDISELVLRGIARTRRVSKPKKKPAKSRLEEFEDGPTKEEISEALKERQERADQAQEVRQKTTDDRRAEQLKLREERKKAYEARRQKLLAEREARKKAKEEERQKATEKKTDTVNQGN